MRCQLQLAIWHQASHLTSACTWTSTNTNGVMALLHTFLLCFTWTSLDNFPRKSYASVLHVRMFSGKHAAQLLLSCMKSGGSRVGKGAKTKQPTFTTACQWSQQRLPMQSHSEGSKSQRVSVCLYSLTASQNRPQLRLSKIVDTLPSVVL